MDPIYLDHNATTPVYPQVARAIAECYAAGYANPASSHRPGREAHRVLDLARDGVAQLLGAELSGRDADQILFTSGGTEANNLAIRGLVGRGTGRVIISAIEHPSIVGAAEHLRQNGYDIQRLPVSRDGVVDVHSLPRLLTTDTRLVSVMLGNHETGVLQPMARLVDLCRQATVPLHCDAIQAVGKVPVDFRALGVTAMSVSAHKFHGPTGVGALLVRSGTPLEPVLFGGSQQLGLRPGTESLPLAVGMHRALEIWKDHGEEIHQRMHTLRRRLEEGLRRQCPTVVINGQGADRLPHTSSVSFPGLDRQALLIALDMAGVACSAGSACTSGSAEPSPVLRAMGCPEAVVHGAVRISLGATTTADDVVRATRRILRVVNDLEQRKSGPFGPTASRGKLP